MSEKTDEKVVVKRGGFPAVVAEFRTVKLITTFLTLLLLVDIFFSAYLLVQAIQIRNHLGYFIDMVVTGDGDILPSLQAMPVFFFVLINLGMGLFLYLAFDKIERPSLNLYMFLLAVFGFILLIIILIIMICVITHAYGTHQSLHDGIVTAMKNYSTSAVYKYQVDQLQIEFQCCGSKKYDDWYTIKWLDSSLEKEANGSMADGNTPFSCCSMKSLFPCIHHGIEVTGKAYLYTPEFNLSISTRGCYDIIREQKQQVGWGIVGNLFLYYVFETFTVILFRFIQTAHFEKSRFSGHARTYAMWIFGSSGGRVKADAPEPPPVPKELKN